MQRRRCYRWPDSNVRALEEALGAAPESRICIVTVPPEVQGVSALRSELAEFLSGAVLAASGHAAAVQPNAPAPCRECGIRTTENDTLREAQWCQVKHPHAGRPCWLQTKAKEKECHKPECVNHKV